MNTASRRPTKLCLAVATTLVALAWRLPARAFEIDTGSDWQVRWDNTLKYTSASRIRSRDPALVADPNRDDGDRNFAPGLISSRLDLLSELDVVRGEKGLHLSGAAWYDTVYNRANDNDSPATANPFSVPHDHFPEATRRLHGRQAELLNAFVFANGQVAGVPASIRAGRHTLLWGESLLLATNGISYAQAPLDFIKALSVPGTQAKELFLPVGQVSGQLRPTPAFSLAAYYQYDWRKTRLPAAGSYFSSSDLLDEGGERLFAGPPGAAFFRGRDQAARDSGQYGISARYRSESLNTDFGLYWIQFHDKLPQIYLRPGVGADPFRGQIGEYSLVYPENIHLVGASFATTVGEVSLAGEVHLRRDTPLASLPAVVLPGQPADNRHHARYAVGDTVHAQLSALYTFASTPLWGSADLAAEVGWQRRTRVTRNPEALDPGRDREAWAVQALFTPNYYEVRENLDISVPVALSYSPKGKAPLPVFDAPNKGGTLSVGIAAVYRKQWNAGLQLTHFFGDATFQPLKDRDFVSLSVQRTF